MRKHLAAPLLLLFACLSLSGADFSGSQTLNALSTINFDTGVIGANSGGDFLWTGSSLVPQGNALMLNIGNLGSTGFNNLSQATISALSSYTATPISADTLTANDVFVVKTNSGRYGKVLVTSPAGPALNNAPITLQFMIYGATPTPQPTGPAVTSIQNNYSNVPAGFPNHAIAPGSIFVVKGSGLADPNAQAVLQSSSGAGLPNALNGATVSVTVNGVTTRPSFYYATANQLALVLPSNTPVGTGTLTVTYNGTTSQPMPITVLPSAIGLNSYYGTGSGLAVASNATTGNPINYANAARPGDIITLWGSGLGAIPGDPDTTYTSSPHASSLPFQAWIGGVPANVLYRGNSGYPGLNQINLVIPTNAPTGCNVSLQASSSNVVSNVLTIPIAAGGGACADPALGITGTELQTLVARPNVNTGLLTVSQSTTPVIDGTATTNSATANFTTVPGSSLASGMNALSLGSCTTMTGALPANAVNLNTGAITITGPAGNSPIATAQSTGGFSAQLPGSFIPAAGGNYTFQGAGGTVGGFSVTVPYPSNPIVWSNANVIGSSILRSQGATVTWTGGSTAPGTYVRISGESTSRVGGQSYTGSFTCLAPASAGTFTVPGSVLQTLPIGAGSLTVSNLSNSQRFNATGLDFGFAQAGASTQRNITYF